MITAGNWIVDHKPQKYGNKKGYHVRPFSLEHDTESIAFVYPTQLDEGDALSNARLIAAAPNLLEACKKTIARLEIMEEEQGLHMGDSELIILKEAVNKAEAVR
jgi:hypothetical protein